MYGLVWRVGVGAVLSSVDAATDIYVVGTYYSEGLHFQANVMLGMISANLGIQILVVLGQYKKKRWTVKLKESLITLFFLRPIVDAYRVTTHHEDGDATMDSLTEMIGNKCVELAAESIPGCVLQIYVWLVNPDEIGIGALISILTSALTTGFASAMISFDFDVDRAHRKGQPNFYGYIPDDHELRGRCFLLMTIISTLHSLSRSVGCALLAASHGKTMLVYFVGGEVLFFVVYKVVRGDFLYWVRVEGPLGVLLSLITRSIVKVVVDFSGCLHFRHPYELGGLAFSVSMLWVSA